VSEYQQLINDYVAAANSHDADATAAFMADDVDFEDVAMGEVLIGRDAVCAFFDAAASTLSSDSHIDVAACAGGNGSLSLEWVLSGTHDGSSPMLPATGRPFTIRGVTVATVVDDKFTRYRDYYDLAAFLGQVGVLPSA
jgi:steroid delta-isomerase-like uncharacterized protein